MGGILSRNKPRDHVDIEYTAVPTEERVAPVRNVVAQPEEKVAVVAPVPHLVQCRDSALVFKVVNCEHQPHLTAIVWLQIALGPNHPIYQSESGRRLESIGHIEPRTKYCVTEALVYGVQFLGEPEAAARATRDYLDGRGPRLVAKHTSNFAYTVGQRVLSDRLAGERSHLCCHGIHFFIDRDSACTYDSRRVYNGFWPVIGRFLRHTEQRLLPDAGPQSVPVSVEPWTNEVALQELAEQTLVDSFRAGVPVRVDLHGADGAPVDAGTDHGVLAPVPTDGSVGPGSVDGLRFRIVPSHVQDASSA